MKTFDLAIIGAGSVGVPLSFYLAKKGLKVVVFEKMPSIGRGQNKAAIGGIRATHSDPAKIKICQRTIQIVKNMKEEYGMDLDWIAGGYLYPVYTEEHETALKNLLLTQKKLKLNIDWISPGDIEKLVPGINSDELRGGTFSPEDGSASPLKLIDAYYLMAKNAGVSFRFNEVVLSLKIEGNRIRQIITAKGNYAADLVVNAAGARAKEIGQMTDSDLPVYPDSHEAGITEPVQRCFQPMVVDIRPDEHSANYYFYQNIEGQVVFCLTPEPKIPGLDMDSTSEFLPLVIKKMLRLYPRLRNIRVRRTWRGLYPMTPDGFPIVGYAREVENMIFAVGMCGQGFMIGPGLAEILAEIIVDKSGKYNYILDQLTLYRSFSGDEMLK